MNRLPNLGSQGVSPSFFFGKNSQAGVGLLDQNYHYLSRLSLVKDLSRYHHKDNLRLNLPDDSQTQGPPKKKSHLENDNLLSKMGSKHTQLENYGGGVDAGH